MKISLFESVKNPNAELCDFTWQGLGNLLKAPLKYDSKEDCELLSAATYEDNYRLEKNVIEHSAVIVDYDKGELSPRAAADIFKSYSLSCYIYTTPTHTPEKPKWRAIFESGAISNCERLEYVDNINGMIGGGLDKSCADNSRSYYYGRLNEDYQFIDLKGDRIDQVSMIEKLPSLPLKGDYKATVYNESDDDLIELYEKIEREEALRVHAEQSKEPIPESEIPKMRDALWHIAKKGGAANTLECRAIGLMLKNSGKVGLKLWGQFCQHYEGQGKWSVQRIKEIWLSLCGQNGGYRDIYKSEYLKDWKWQDEREVKPKLLMRLCDRPKIAVKPKFLIDNRINKGSMVSLYGGVFQGKSYVTLEMAFCITASIDYYGEKVNQADVVYICGEGFHGVENRVKALCAKYELDEIPTGFMITQSGIDFFDDKKVCDLATEIAEMSNNCGLVVLDTFSRCFIGGDENSAKDLNIFTDTISRHFLSKKISVLIVNHTSKGNENASRGSNAMHGNCDIQIKVHKDKDGVVHAEWDKTKDFRQPEKMEFMFRSEVETTFKMIDEDTGQITNIKESHLITKQEAYEDSCKEFKIEDFSGQMTFSSGKSAETDLNCDELRESLNFKFMLNESLSDEGLIELIKPCLINYTETFDISKQRRYDAKIAINHKIIKYLTDNEVLEKFNGAYKKGKNSL